MKIKKVCEQTGLTDRTIRYYIEEGLINPETKENYLGRKSIDFSDSDIGELKNISVLRKVGFSVSDIKAIKSKPMNSIEIIRKLKNEKRREISDNEEIIAILETLGNFSEYDINTLADKLRENAGKSSLPDGEIKEKVKNLARSAPKTLLAIIAAFVPMVFVIMSFKRFAYPDITLWSIAALFLTVVPSIFGIRAMLSKDNCYGTLIACIIYLPVSFIFSVFAFNSSTTTDISNYLIMDNRIREDEIFPKYAHTFENIIDESGNYKAKYIDTKYYYHYKTSFDYTYDIYAEWSLEREAFYKEIDRVKGVFEYGKENMDGGFTEYTAIKKGNYTCLIKYQSELSDENDPFSTPESGYDYSIFAYDEDNCRVRYINCYSLENGADKPYFLQLEW